MINVTLPPQKKGEPYKQCFTLTGTGPFTLVSNNVDGDVKIVGDQVCVSIAEPKAAFEMAVAIQANCAYCKAVTFVSQIGFTEDADDCPCVPVTVPAQTIPPLPATPALYFANIRLDGTGPFELCGGSAPRCLTVRLTGNIVEVSGKYEGVGKVKFSVKNACTCDCVDVEIL